VPLGFRIVAGSLLPRAPSSDALASWRSQYCQRPPKRKRADISKTSEQVAEEILLHLPPEPVRRVTKQKKSSSQRRLYKKLDPVKLLLALNMVRMCRQAVDIANVVHASNEYQAGDVIDTPRPRDADPAKSSLQRAMARADVLGMLLDQRLFAMWRVLDLLVAVQVYTDASPVTGEELQGLILECLLRDGTVHSMVLPGSTLTYGQYGALAKVVALLWSLALCVGFSTDMLLWVLSKVNCITTDFGNEIRTLEAPNFVEAFVRWSHGRPLRDCAPLVMHAERLFPEAIRLVGWSHTLGGVMKKVCDVAPTWPVILSAIRCLCSFFRVQAWRHHLQFCLRDKPDVDPACLQSFTGQVATWRYETAEHVMRQLMKVRHVAEHYVVQELFQNFKDRTTLVDVLRHCRGKALWTFIAIVWTFVMQPLEGLRRWGMVCDCHEDERHEHPGKQFHCKFSGRRLGKAWQFVKDRLAELRESARTLTTAMCEGSASLRKIVSDMLQAAVSLLHHRFKYLGRLPWVMATCESVDGAVAVMEEWRSQPPENHDPYTRLIMNGPVGVDIDARARGEAITNRLAEFLHRFCYGHRWTRGRAKGIIGIRTLNMCGRQPRRWHT
jgi:hypothetical protein